MKKSLSKLPVDDIANNLGSITFHEALKFADRPDLTANAVRKLFVATLAPPWKLGYGYKIYKKAGDDLRTVLTSNRHIPIDTLNELVNGSIRDRGLAVLVGNENLTEAHIGKLLKDRSPNVKAALLEHHYERIPIREIERLMQSGNYYLRRAAEAALKKRRP